MFEIKKTFIVGNTISNVIKKYVPAAEKDEILNRLNLTKNKYFVMTLHRLESVYIKSNLSNLFKTFEALHKIYNYPTIFPIHPRTKDKVKILELLLNNNIKIIEPLRYLEFLKLTKDSKLILSDSGGFQEEASILGVPCVTRRTSTERQITLTRNVNILAGYNKDRILKAVKKYHNKKIKDFGQENVTNRIYKKIILNYKIDI